MAEDVEDKAKDVARVEQDMSDITSRYYGLQTQLSTAVKTLTSDINNPKKEDVIHQLSMVQAKADQIGKSLGALVSTPLGNEQLAPDSSTAANALHIPEILELVLLNNTSVFDIVNMRQTCSGLKAIIEASPKLLMLRPSGVLAGRNTKIERHPLCGHGFTVYDLTQSPNLRIQVIPS